jgi:hypothetical protein
MSLRFFGCGVALGGALVLVTAPASAQNFRFELRAEPDVIPANGLSTTSIFVQLPQNAAAITPVSNVRFATTAGSIESQAILSGGVARVLLRSSTTPGTATVTAFIGNARETTTVEFSEDTGLRERFLEVAAPYVAYGNGTNIITSSGASSVDFGDLHVESDVRLDIDLTTERLWAQGNAGGVRIRSGHGAKMVELRGDRLFYDLRRRQGVMRRFEGDSSDSSKGARQEFTGAKFEPLPPLAPGEQAIEQASGSAPKNPSPTLLAPPQAPTSSAQGRDNLSQPPQQTPAPLPNPTQGEQSPVPMAPEAPVASSAESVGSKNADSRAPEPNTGAAQGTSSDAPASADASAPSADASAPSADASPASADASPATAAPVEANSASSSATSPGASPGGVAVVPGSLADTPAPIAAGGGDGTRSNPLVAQPKPVPDGAPGLEVKSAPYKPFPDKGGPPPRIVELPPPGFDATDGYWVTARRLRVFPRDKVQFERAKIYFNGQKAFALPLYVLPLDGSFNPTTDILAFNSRGGVGVNFPVPYLANSRGTGTLYLQNQMGGGFGTQNSGPSVALKQQYWLSSRSHGNFSVDQIGHGDFNVNASHEQQLDGRTVANFYLNAPRHRDLFARATVQRDLSGMQIGFESFFDQLEGQTGNLRGQFFARMKPKTLGKTGWQYTVSANALGVGRVAYDDSAGLGNGIGSGSGVGLPGRGGGIGLPGGTDVTMRYRSLFGQTLNASVTSPQYSPWRGSNLSANLLASAYNFSDNRRGLAPGMNLFFNQAVGKNGVFSLAYTYDRSSIGLYGSTGTSFTHYFTANLNTNLTSKLAVSAFASRSLSDQSLYGSAGVDYFFAPKWRLGAFADYANFSNGLTSNLNTGWSLGRTVANRELSVNFDSTRRKLYFQYGGVGGFF